jgi:hypothetical protein
MILQHASFSSRQRARTLRSAVHRMRREFQTCDFDFRVCTSPDHRINVMAILSGHTCRVSFTVCAMAVTIYAFNNSSHPQDLSRASKDSFVWTVKFGERGLRRLSRNWFARRIRPPFDGVVRSPTGLTSREPSVGCFDGSWEGLKVCARHVFILEWCFAYCRRDVYFPERFQPRPCLKLLHLLRGRRLKARV